MSKVRDSSKFEIQHPKQEEQHSSRGLGGFQWGK
jgi:hypothetical protein